MNQYDPRSVGYGQASRAEIDEGLRSYMLRVYNYMALGIAFTGNGFHVYRMSQTADNVR